MIEKLHEYFSLADDSTTTTLKMEKLREKLNEVIDIVNLTYDMLYRDKSD
jgi:hypothetical protein